MKNFQNQVTILLIESDSSWLADVRSTLSKAGYDVLTATGGDQGFCAARRVRPDLIVCETALPDLSGIQLCYMLRADKNLRYAPFVLIGATNDQTCDAAAAEALRAGADDCFAANCCRDFLAAKIARLIALRRSEAELRRRRQALRRSESRLAKIIEDTSNLVAVLDPAHSSAALNSYDVLRLKNFFGTLPSTKERSTGKNADAMEIWKPVRQTDDFVEASCLADEKREKVYYEVVR